MYITFDDNLQPECNYKTRTIERQVNITYSQRWSSFCTAPGSTCQVQVYSAFSLGFLKNPWKCIVLSFSYRQLNVLSDDPTLGMPHSSSKFTVILTTSPKHLPTLSTDLCVILASRAKRHALHSQFN